MCTVSTWSWCKFNLAQIGSKLPECGQHYFLIIHQTNASARERHKVKQKKFSHRRLGANSQTEAALLRRETLKKQWKDLVACLFITVVQQGLGGGYPLLCPPPPPPPSSLNIIYQSSSENKERPFLLQQVSTRSNKMSSKSLPFSPTPTSEWTTSARTGEELGCC